MNKQIKLLLIIIAIAGIFLWLQSYYPFLKLWNSVVIFTGLLAVVLRLITNVPNKIIILSVPGGFMGAYVIKVIIDVIADSTSHNLWPIEIILLSIITVLSALVGLGLGILIKKIAAKFYPAENK